jgi:hypothetical protein
MKKLSFSFKRSTLALCFGLVCLILTSLACRVELFDDLPATQTSAALYATLAANATAQANPTRTITPTRTVTPTATITPNLTATQLIQSTAAARSMAQDVRLLAESGLLHSTHGVYHALPDWEESWAKIDWYQSFPTGFSARNFVIRARANWDTASPISNWFATGCGFVFAYRDLQNHHMAFMALDGTARLYRWQGGQFNETYHFFRKMDIPSGSAQLMLVVDEDWINLFVDGEEAARWQDPSLISGDIGLTLNSGTNKDFGTRCSLKNIELWEVQD